jgi:transposase
VVTFVRAMTGLAPTAPQEQFAALEAALAAERAKVAELTQERDQLRASHERLRLELELLKRRIFIAKAERVDTRQLELDFAATLAALDKLAGLDPQAAQVAQTGGESGQADTPKSKPKKKPTGRRDLSKMPLEEVRVEITDDVFEKLVAEGKAERIDFDVSYKLVYKRGGYQRLAVAKVLYRVIGKDGDSQVATALAPLECFPRSLAAPSALAHVLSEKYTDGMPLNRQESRAAREGAALDRGTMCRWIEDAGATAGATVVAAMREDAFKTAFCIATDATGISVQPEPRPDGAHQPCRRGHYFVLIADRDHVLFEYTAKETSAFVEKMFAGYSGYVQADAKSVYDVLFREPEKPPPEGEEVDERSEVGCLAHCRRKFWEATCAKSEVAREGLARLGRIFALEEAWRADPPETIKRLRNQHLRPHLEAFFSWAAVEYEKVRDQRGLLRSALGYAVRQKDALMRVLEDGRLVIDNNRSERALRQIAVGRKAWLFVGSDGHAESAGHVLSLVASCRLHGLDPEAYLRDLFRVLAHWPQDRYLEIAPKYWTRTRARLDARELAAEIGPLTIPPPLAATLAEEQASAD